MADEFAQHCWRAMRQVARERRQIAIDVNVAGRIAGALGVDVAALFQAEAPVSEEPDVSRQEGLLPEAKRLLALWQPLATDDRHALQRCAELLAYEEADIQRKTQELIAMVGEIAEARALKRGPDGAEAGDADSAMAG